MPLFKKFTGNAANTDPNAEKLESIIDNLNNVLNTRKGYGSFLEHYGIRDMNEYSSRDHLAVAIMAEVRHCIDKYEPRLTLVDIAIEDNNNPFRISFKIECRVKETAQFLFMEFDSVYNDFHLKNL